MTVYEKANNFLKMNLFINYGVIQSFHYFSARSAQKVQYHPLITARKFLSVLPFFILCQSLSRLNNNTFFLVTYKIFAIINFD